MNALTNLRGRFLIVLFLALLASPVFAVVDLHEFDNESQRLRYLSFSEELRCPKCQNQNLSGSNSPIASDLRRELHRLLIAGKTDEEIIDFMVSRYGEYVLYRPRMQGATWALWLAPGILLLAGLLILFFVLQNRRKTQVVVDVELTDQQKNQLAALLAKREGSSSNKVQSKSEGGS